MYHGQFILHTKKVQLILKVSFLACRPALRLHMIMLSLWKTFKLKFNCRERMTVTESNLDEYITIFIKCFKDVFNERMTLTSQDNQQINE